MTSLLDAVRTLATPVFCRRRSSVTLRHRATGVLFGGVDDDALAFTDEAEARRFLGRHACEPDAWEPVPVAG